MSSSRNPSPKTSQPKEWLSKSVYEVQPGLQRPGDAPQVEIIWFHGLQQTDDYSKAFLTAWKSREGKVVWIKAWLGSRLRKARILSISYDYFAGRLDGQSDTFIIAENLINDLVSLENPVGQRCPVVLVGHSLGGILIKSLFLACDRMRVMESGERLEQIQNFQNNCKGVFYYSTPHGGSRIADVISRIPIRQNEPLIKLFRMLDTQTARINSGFNMRRQDPEVKTWSVVEGLDTNYKGITVRVVPEASARQDGANYYTAQADHFDVCRPKDNLNDPIFRCLLLFIIDTLGEDNIEVSPRDPEELTKQMTGLDV